MSTGELILYTTEDGGTRVRLRAEDGTVWLSQLEMAELFSSSKQNIGQHIKNVLADGELAEHSVVKQNFTTASIAVLNFANGPPPTCANSWSRASSWTTNGSRIPAAGIISMS